MAEEGNTPKVQGSRMEKTLWQLFQEMKTVREDLQKGQESTKQDIQLLREDLNQEMEMAEEGNTPKVQGSRMEKTLQQLYQEMKTVREDLQKLKESTKRDIQLLREDLNQEMDRKIEKMERAQESKMAEEFQELYQRIQGLEYELHGRLGSQEHNLQLLRAETGMEQGKTEEGNTPKVQGSRLEETLQQLCQEMKAVCEDLQKGQESRLSATAHRCCLEMWRGIIPTAHPAPRLCQALRKAHRAVLFPQPCYSQPIQPIQGSW